MKSRKLTSMIMAVVMVLGVSGPVYADEKNNLPNIEVGKITNYVAQYEDLAPEDFEHVPIVTANTWAKNRIYGQDRFETANKIADEFCKTNEQLGLTSEYGKYVYPDCATTKIDTVILANGFNYPDALCATPLSKTLNAPILLTHENNLTPSTKEQIKKMQVQNVTIVGGEGVVTPQVENELKSMGLNVNRLGGIDRYETSYKIALKVSEGRKINGATIVSGIDWHDAMIASPTAAIKDIPMLLVPIVDNPILPQYKELLASNNLNIDRVYSYGDDITETTPEILKKMIPESIAHEGGFRNCFGIGKNKYVNCFDILKHQYYYILPYSVGENVFMTNGQVFADSLSVAPLAAKMSSPIVFGTTVNNGWSKWDEFVNDAEIETKKTNYPVTPEGSKAFCDKVVRKISINMRGITLIGGPTVVPDNASNIFEGIWEY